MPDFYTSLKNTASNLLQNKGRLITFTRNTENSFNPATGEVLNYSSTYTGYGATFDYKKNEIDETIVKSGDIRLLLESTTTAPERNDTCVIDSITYRIMNVTPLSPAGTVVTYTVQLRK